MNDSVECGVNYRQDCVKKRERKKRLVGWWSNCANKNRRVCLTEGNVKRLLLEQQCDDPAGSEDQRAAAALCVDELTITRCA